MKLDFTDIRILEIMQLNARTSIADLAKSVGISPSTALSRLRALESSGVIDYYSAVVSLGSAAEFIEVFIRVTLNDHSQEANEDFQTMVWEMPEIISCFLVNGASEYLMHVLTSDTAELQRAVVERLTQLPQVDALSTELVLDAVKTDYLMPLRSIMRTQAAE